MNTDLHIELIEKIKSARIKQGVSQSVMAEKLGMSQPSYGRFESGQSMIDILQLVKVCQILMIPIHKVLRQIYVDSDFEFIELKEANRRLENDLRRREDYIKVLKYNIEDAIKTIKGYKENRLTLDELNDNLSTLSALLDVISKHEIP